MSPQTGLFAADFGEEVVSVAPDDHVAHSPLNPLIFDYFVPLLTTLLHFSPHLKDVWRQVKQNREDL
jgi:hypothetical protein